MQGIENYIPETNHVIMGYTVAGVLYLQFMARVLSCTIFNCMFIYISTLLPVQCPIWLFPVVP